MTTSSTVPLRRIPVFLTLLQLVVVQQVAASEPVRLIAHRGGVVNETIIENNRAAIDEAVRRGYWMVEADIQTSRDGVLVVHHDPTFERFYNDPRRLAEMDWAEIAELRSTPGNERPLRFGEFAEACHGRLQLMLDIKGDDVPVERLTAIEAILVDHDLLRGAYVLGSDRTKSHFRGRARISGNADAVFAAADRGEPVAKDYFLFDRGSRLSEPIIIRARELNVPVVAAINRIRYPDDEQQALTLAKADIERLRTLGVTQFQIDSQYDPWLLAAPEQ